MQGAQDSPPGGRYSLSEVATRCYRMPLAWPEAFSPVSCPACCSEKFHVVAFELVFRIVKCAACGHIYLNPVPDEAYVAAYNSTKISDALGYQEAWLSTRSPAARWIARWCRKRFRKGGSVADIGTGFGDLLLLFDPHVWRRSGVELSPAVAAEANKALGEGTVRVGDAATVELPRGQYDVVCLVNVIEHLASPDRVLANIRPSLAPGGVLLVRWPQLLFLYTLQSLAGRSFPGIQAPCHLHDFRRRSIERLLARCGYSVVRHYVVNNMDALKRRGTALRCAMRSIDLSSRFANWISLGRRCAPWGSVVTVAGLSRS